MKMKNYLKKVGELISKLWTRADAVIDKVTPIAIKVVEEIKKVNECATGDIIEQIVTAIIPGEKDNLTLALLRKNLYVILPKVLLQLNMVQAISSIEDPNEQFRAIINSINFVSNEGKNAYYHILCAKIIEALSDQKLTWSESVYIAEYYYNNIYEK